MNHISKYSAMFMAMPFIVSCGETVESAPKNVLFIIVDDLRPELGCFGADHIISPNINKFASESTSFDRAYCNIPVSGASRASLFTGVRSHWDTFLTAESWMDKDAADCVTLPELFRQNGYYTVSESKVFHHETDRVSSWDECSRPKPNGRDWKDYLSFNSSNPKEKTPVWECVDAQDNDYVDGKTAEIGVQKLRELQKAGKPFFLGLGFLKPHLPFTAPKKYWDMYDRDSIVIPESYRAELATIPKRAIHNSGELRTYADVPKERIFSDDYAKELIHGYYACVSYTDAQIGKVLDEVKRLGLDENTIIVFVGDHGWNLGEHGMWAKHCNFTTSIKAPFIMKIPGEKPSKVASIVEYVDIFPTLCDLCGVEKPADQLQGESLLPVIESPSEVVSKYAVSKFKGGLTLISEDYTYTEWQDKDGKVLDRMLFHITSDSGEMVNIAEDEKMKRLVEEFSYELNKRKGY